MDRTTLSSLLRSRARTLGPATFLRTVDDSISYAETDQRVDEYAAGLRERGVGPGDRVVLVLPNSIDHVLLWLAVNRLGAINVPLNPAITGDLRERSIRLVQPALVITDVAGLRVPAPRVDHHPVEVLTTATMLFTSGSTGVPKACELSHRYLVRQGQIHAKYLQLQPNDVLFTPFPLFHIDAATLTVGTALTIGATAALSERFSASRFWDEIRACDATVFNFMGATAHILWKQRPTGRDRDHRVRLAWGVPMPDCEPQWQARFGFPLVEVYGSTDAGLPAYQPLDGPRRTGSCGRIIPEYEVRVVDESGADVPRGAPGEILVRSTEPGLLMNGYFGMPDATRTALRGGWFHTGDIGRLDADDYLYFVSRNCEVIRRRGENIAAGDVEQAFNSHPAVAECAAVGIASELTEDDVRVFLVPQPEAHLQLDDVLEHCRQLLPGHMIPRYVDLVERLPKTPTEKIERFRLAALSLTPTTWDVAAGRAVAPA